MKTGMTYFEKMILPHQGEGYLETLAASGYKHVEFSPHPSLISNTDLKRLINKAESLGLSVGIHNPDFANPYLYSVNHFKNHSQMRKAMVSLFEHLINICQNTEPLKFVIHGASATQHRFSTADSETAKAQLMDLNLSAFDYFANQIIKRNLPIQLLLENTCQLDEFSATQTAADLRTFFNKIQGAPIDLCLDLPHWFRQCKSQSDAPESCFCEENQIFFDRISYAHIHGVSENLEKSHLAMDTENSFYFDFVKGFYAKKDEIIFNLEIFDLQGIVNFSTFESVAIKSIQSLVEICR